MSAAEDPIAEHGWTAVRVDADAIFKGKPYLYEPGPLLVKDIHFPSDDPIVAKAQAYAKDNLPVQTYNHSMRVYYFASAILQDQFPAHRAALSPATLALAALLHDIGTAPAFLTSTLLSFEFHGAITALNLLTAPPHPAPAPQAEAVCEAIIRHQDLGKEGTITFLGQLLQLATVYDNVGRWAYLVHEETRRDVNREFPRRAWGACFATTVREEVRVKPWAHSTHLGGAEEFANAVEGNLLMAEYE
ncbi:cyanamide hydratase [Parathielavia appendiculata]|uniref:Cyanamide hydratase n=1 Tax=Parathielavia appendiculata TaxID=2587402 RepID=A0AAN6U5S8_9PEZI|nr:cyanamide hydratase [Parathielavia appendiculata]